MAKSTIALGLTLVLLLVCGCAPAAKAEVPVTVTCDQFSKQANIVQDISVKMGNKVVVTLCSNPTTGFQWSEKAQIGDPQVLEQKSYKFVAPADTGMVGVPGNAVWTFEAMGLGTSTVYLEYSRNWQGGEKAVQTFKLNVLVQ
ncbi:MAG: protease inhibitor I42 family protein [Chloroflexi bacterium]|nr:protease inhibitor I42 family protein [Chloroflexota bacterium]